MNIKKISKILAITIGVVILLTWIMPSATYSGYGTEVIIGQINPAGIWDVLSSLGIAIAYFWEAGLFILLVGILYEIINETGTLKGVVDKLRKKFKGHEKRFLFISVIFFLLIASLTGIYLPLFLFVPFFIAVILSMGYSKEVALLATIGSVIVGNIGLLYNNMIQQNLYLTGFSNLWYRLVLLLLSLVLTLVYVVKTAKIKRGRKSLNESMLFIEEKDKPKTKVWPLITSFIIIFILLIAGLTPWFNMFELKLFDNLHSFVMDVKIGNFFVFQSLFGQTLPPLGQWDITTLFPILILVSLFIALAYKLSGKQIIDASVRGLNKLMPFAVIAVLVNIIVVLTLNSGFYITMVNFLVGLTKNFNLCIIAINTFIGSILTVDSLYFANYTMGITSGLINSEASNALLALVGQTMYASAMLLVPSSIFLLVGLSYVDISYKDWLKYIWRLLLLLLILIFVVLIIAVLL